MAPRKGKPINTLYVDTVYWLFTFDVEKPDFIRSEFFKESYFDDVSFCFQAVSSSDTSIAIELLRVLKEPDRRPDDGYSLELYITLLGSLSATQCRIMDSESVLNYVSVDYEIADLKNNRTKVWTVKCVIKMQELDYLDNNLRDQQEILLRDMKNNQSFGKDSKDKSHAMASLLKRKSLSKIFTGRQTNSFAINKCIFIERTMRYAVELDNKFEAKKKNTLYVQKHQPLIYLSHIYWEKRENISIREAADLYIAAHYYGLEYLQVECAEFMLKDLEHESVIDVLLVADLVNDQDLMDKLLEIFIKYKTQIRATTQFINVMNHEIDCSHSVLHALIRKVQQTVSEQNASGTSTGKKSKPSDSTAPVKSSGRKHDKKRSGKGGKS